MPDHLFAYGTLQPGLAPPAVRGVADRLIFVATGTTPGLLYDLGTYPGAVFDGGGTIHGTVLLMPMADLLADLDVYEGVPDLYRRTTVPVATAGGPISCWAYEYVAPIGPAQRRLPAGRYPP